MGKPDILRAILRSVSPLAQQYLLRLTFVHGPFSIKDIAAWCISPNAVEHEEALYSLTQMHLLQPQKDGFGRVSDVALHPGAQRVMQRMMQTPPLLPASSPCITPVVVGGNSYKDSGEYGRERWGLVLDFMVNPDRQLDDPNSEWLKGILLDMGLMDYNTVGNTEEWCVNKEGCKFLLQESSRQVWDVLLEYLEAGASNPPRLEWAERVKFDPHQVMELLCKLSFLDHTQQYNLDALGLTECQREAARDFIGCGLTLPHCKGTICPTAYATGHWAVPSTVTNSNYGIIVESNFRVYFHREPDLEGETNEALLNLFTRIDYALPNLVAATLIRSQVVRGLERGISVDFMQDFMLKHAHHSMNRGPKQTAKLPSNV